MSEAVPRGRVTLRSPDGHTEAVIDAEAGGRVARLRIRDLDVILTEGFGAIAWGAYPMVPWAGRLRDGRFEWDGRTIAVERTMPPNAIHGTALYRPWRVTDARPSAVTLEVDLAPAWPLGGRAVHRVELDDDELRAILEVDATDRPMPAIVGWHPWFPRRLARGGELELDFRPTAMLVRGDDHLPTGAVVDPPPGPWDDAFTGVVAPPRLRWPGAISVEIRSDAPYWVVYTEQPHAIAVEPQTGPPNGLATGDATIVEPGRPLVASMAIAWLEDDRPPRQGP